MLFTSHNMAEVEEICDRIIFIHGGKIIANDTPENLAKSIKISHVELHIKDGLKRLDEYTTKRNLPYHKKGREIIQRIISCRRNVNVAIFVVIYH